MSPPVQVIYATNGGSTGEVAEAVGAALREAGVDGSVTRARDAKLAGAGEAVILGAPLYMGRLPGEMRRFLRQNRNSLSSIRPWFFVLGPIEGKPEEFVSARKQA